MESPKHQAGGLIDIEFIAQLGVLCTARLYPRVLNATGTLRQLDELSSIGWLTDPEANELKDTARLLRRQRMMTSLVQDEDSKPVNTKDSAELFIRKMGDSSRPLP